MRNDEDGSEREQYRRSDTVLDTAQDTELDRRDESPVRSGGDDSGDPLSGRDSLSDRTESGASRARTVTDLAESLAGRNVTVDTESISATLIGVPRVDIHDFVYDHQLGVGHEPDETRSIAMFDLENTGQYPVTWRCTRTRFVGTDGYTYQPSQLSLDPSQLGPGCHTRQVEIDPNRRARVVTLVEQLPAGVEVAEVVHKLTTYGDSQRLTFAVE